MILVIKHIGVEGAGSIADFFRGTARSFNIIEAWNGEDIPAGLQGVEAVISLGGPMNVYEEDKYPFLKAEDALLKEALKKEIPILGICLGAQLLAKACGARIEKNPARELGWYNVSLTGDGKRDKLFSGFPEDFGVFQWHQDTFGIPASAIRLAKGNSCLNQAFRAGSNAYGLQFHIEVDPGIIGSWIKEYRQDVEGVDTGYLLSEAAMRTEGLKDLARRLCLNFNGLI